VLAQLGGVSAELIIIDDGSTDSTPHVIKKLQEDHPGCFRAIRKENGGLSSVRNRGISEARGNYLMFLDADDEMAPSAMTQIEQHLELHPWTKMVIGGHYSVWKDGKRRLHLPANLPETPPERLRGYLFSKHIVLTNGACVLHREVFNRGLYPEQFRSAEDIPVFAQILANYPCTILKQPLAMIHKHADSLRHQFVHAKAGGVALVDEVFSLQRLGPEFQCLKDRYYAQRCLSLFRSAYLANDVGAAKEYFFIAVRKDWTILLKWSYLSKLLRLWTR
jgi:glycosyltransferase involved in cell wall biosynthesis